MNSDRVVVRMVVGLIGLVTVGALILVGVLAYQHKPIPDSLVAPLSAGLGALAALLAKTGPVEPA